MKVVFQDLAHEPNPQNGTEFEDPAELGVFLDRLIDTYPIICELRGENGYSLTVGLGSGVGFVQYARTDGTAPCVVALNDQSVEGSVFDVTEEGQNMPGEWCLPHSILKAGMEHLSVKQFSGSSTHAVNVERGATRWKQHPR